MTLAYAELDARSNFSFLEGGSHPAELVMQAKTLGHAAFGIADRNTLAGVVRAHAEAKKQGVRLLVGCRLVFRDGAELIVYPRDRAAYGRLCRLLSIGKSAVAEPEGDAPSRPPPCEWGRGTTRSVVEGAGLGSELADAPSAASRSPSPVNGGGQVGMAAAEPRIPKGECWLDFEQAVALGEGMIALVPAPAAIDAAFEARLAAWRRAWPDRLYLAASPLHRGDDRARMNRLAAIARRTGARLVAANAVLYHQHERRRLQDVLTCIREGVTIDRAGFRLQANAERFLKSAAEMRRLFKGHEDAVARTAEIVEACRFNLDHLKYEYPDEPMPPGWTPQRWLMHLAFRGAKTRYPCGVPIQVVTTLRKELKLIKTLGYAPYFLTVHDIVAWARHKKNILCQGRGSAANSVVCYCLGVTAVDPVEQDLLIERFISDKRKEPPDIDVDFEHERREEVMQYVYERYGRHRAAICATVIHYRPRSAIRDVGKALGLTEDVTAVMANTVWGSYGAKVEDDHVDRAGLRRDDPRLRLALEITAELINFPRHLSQHVGGFVLTQGPLVETVPVGNAAMEDRTFIEWDKDDIDELGLMKVDVLALGMLTAIRRAFEMIAAHYGRVLDLATVPAERPQVYDMLCQADSLGVFQVESRAQMAMLPRLQPRRFYDLVIEVAIVRPGPIQGGMVHPYLNRRAEQRRDPDKAFDYPAPAAEHGSPDELKNVLHKTLGVPLFQEQAMRIAMVAACFTGDEANGLRRAMATFRNAGTIGQYEEMMVGRMIGRGYDPEFARNCFEQIKGFGEYGFPESHAASFALLVYVSSWLKCFYPEVFAAALLNSQPMGFYAPAQIIRDAREHGVMVAPPDVNASDWDSTLEAPSEGVSTAAPIPSRWRRPGRSVPGEAPRALRLGLRQIDGFSKAWAEAISEAREKGGPFASLDDLRHRAGVPAAALDALAAADALGSLDLTRRGGLWAARGLPRARPAPLFAFAGLDEADGTPPAALPTPPPSEEVVCDYETIRLSLKDHPVRFLRPRLERAGASPAAAIADLPDGRRVAVAGVVLVRQRPGSAKGVCFITLEDETGVANLVLWPKTFEAFRPVVMGARMVLARGRIQRATDDEGSVVHLVVDAVEDRTGDLDLLSEAAAHPPLSQPMAHADGPRHAAPERGELLRHRHPRDVRVLPKSRDFH
ncbi:error-prone DNA polymerase [Caulobacter sp. CCUG 60055]|uniref:error-prone DNA polymerase n=1 Tax=Caulobacter sp. CCUG 60055 TaxID=2100090 RepID=UPI001FA75E18|nr:error-prone DNA polymerase [Caulobacter sp. CCUG 60055]MCI3181326.1 error-prone DNA polymerase [Caulobacter sp. CCUG 60055]